MRRTLSYKRLIPFILRISSFSSSVNSIATSCAVFGLSAELAAPVPNRQLSLTTCPPPPLAAAPAPRGLHAAAPYALGDVRG